MGVFADFWSHPIDSVISILTPSTPVTGDAGGPQSAYGALFGSGGDSLAGARVRASGIDPSTGKPISDAYTAAAVAAGYRGQGQDYIDAVTSMVQSEYNRDYQDSWNSLSLFGGNDSVPNARSTWLLPLLVVLVLAFVFVKVVK